MKKIIPERVIERCCNCIYFSESQQGCNHHNGEIYDCSQIFAKDWDGDPYTGIHPGCPLADAVEDPCHDPCNLGKSCADTEVCVAKGILKTSYSTCLGGGGKLNGD
jgi:hypothetical protein